MATNTAQILNRQDPRQVVNTLKKTINWNDADVADSAFELGLPAGAFITQVLVEIVTAFDGTPTMVVGTVSSAYNNIVASADLDETVAGVTSVLRALGRGLTASAAVIPHSKVTFGGTPTAGQAIVLINYEGGWRT